MGVEDFGGMFSLTESFVNMGKAPKNVQFLSCEVSSFKMKLQYDFNIYQTVNDEIDGRIENN